MMEHSVQAYLKSLPTEALENFLKEYRNNPQKEDCSTVVSEVVHELLRRKGKKAKR